jgi:hypothetical protein
MNKSKTSKILEKILWSTGLIQYRSEIISDNPKHDEIKDSVIYLIGNSEYVKWAYLKCPDNCGKIIMLSLSTRIRPSWSVNLDRLGRISVSPSIAQTEGCRSHFWIKKGKIIWVRSFGI